MYVNNLQSVLPSCANIADCSGWAPPNLPPPRWGGRGAPEEKLSLSPPLWPGLCLPKQLYGNNSHWRRLFPRRGDGGGGRECPVGEGLWGLPRAGASSRGAGGGRPAPCFSSRSPCKGHGMHPAPRMRQAAPRCPHTSLWSSASPLLPLVPHRAGSWMLWAQPGAAGGMPGGAEGQSPLPSLPPSPGPLPSTASSGGCQPLAIPATSFPEAAGQQPEPRSGSNPWL